MSSTTTALISSSTKPATMRASLPPPSPGTWRHPKFTEIVKRQSASTFSDRSLRIAIINSIALVASLFFSSKLYSIFHKILGITGLSLASTTASYTSFLLRLYFLANIFLALRPLLPCFSKPDEVNDIPLTPSQRALLGLPPSNTSTPTSAVSAGYITPPRYRRSSSGSPLSSANSASTTDRRSISANYASSPLLASRQTLGFSPSSSPFPSTARAASGSPFSYSPSASPLLQRAVTRGSEVKDISPLTNGRGSFGASSSTSGRGLSRSHSMRERGMGGGMDSEPRTPSPIINVKRNKGLNYKWMYEKGRKLPKSDSIQF